MTIEEALVAKLTATPAVTALVGTRIYPLAADQALDPQTTGDYITYEVVHDQAVQDHGGAGGLRAARVSFGCSSLTYANAKTIAAALRATLTGFRGTLSGLPIGHILDEEAVDDIDPDDKVRVVHQDFHLMYG